MVFPSTLAIWLALDSEVLVNPTSAKAKCLCDELVHLCFYYCYYSELRQGFLVSPKENSILDQTVASLSKPSFWLDLLLKLGPGLLRPVLVKNPKKLVDEESFHPWYQIKLFFPYPSLVYNQISLSLILDT